MSVTRTENGFDSREYRRVLGGFGTGVALVAAHDSAGRAHGLIVNSLTSVSLHPPVMLWCLGVQCAAFDVFTTCPAFTLNILGAEDEPIARQFSSRGDRIIPPDQVITMETGAPALAAALSSIDCRMRSHQPVGDHEVIFGDVVAYRTTPAAEALGYFQGRYVRLTSGES